MSEKLSKEFRIKSGKNMLDYISKFSSTEKVIFGIFVIIACISALMMTNEVNNLFTTDIPANGGELREGEIGLPRTINPVLAISDVDRDVSALVYSGLTKYSDGEFQPDLAQSWTISSDELSYDFILKNNLLFQDGTPLTADDVAFTIQKIQDPALKSPHQGDWSNISIKVISPNEIQFTLKQPYSGFLSNTTIGIIPKHIWNSVSDDQFIFSQYNIQPIGSGPYKITNINRDSGGIPSSYNLSTWNGYTGKHPYISTVTFVFFPNQTKAIDALNSSEIDSLPSIDPSTAQELATNTAQNYTIQTSSLPRIFGVFFNQSQSAVLADPVVRQALDMATDRNDIIKNVLSGYGIPAYGPIPKQLFNDLNINNSDNNDGSSMNSLKDAQTLLEKNGWVKDSSGIYEKKSSKTKSPATILAFDIYTADAPDLVKTANLLKSQWTNMGAEVGVQIFESSDLYQNIIRTRKYDALLFGEQVGKDRDLYAFWNSSQRNAPGLNVSLYTNSKVDSILSDIRGTMSTTTLALDYTKLNQLIQNDLPAIFLYSPDFIYAVPKSLQGMKLDSIAIPTDHWNSIENWYIKTQSVWNIFKNNQ